MEYSKEQLEHLQNIEIGILKAFTEVCEKLNLTYWIIGGTLLGAIRNKGFIPWDDDVDVFMTRKDYEIFTKEGQKLLGERYFFQSYKTEKNYPRCYAKLCDCYTTCIEQATKNYPMNHGVYVDVFPLDYCYEEVKLHSRLMKKKKFLYRCIDKNYNYPGFMNKIRGIIKHLIYFYPWKYAVRKLDELFQSVPPSGKYINYFGAWGNKEIFPVEYFKESIIVEFCGLKVKAPKEYDKILTQVYGNYMELPPEEKRITHHNFVVVDMNKSYKEYCK